MVAENVKQRQMKNIQRDDMINLLLLTKQGKLNNETESNENDFGFASNSVAEEIMHRSIEKLRELDDDDFVAQCLAFFLAGFTGVATTIATVLYELARNPDVQERLLREIDEVKDGINERNITFEMIQNMKYLDQVVLETLRLWPIAVMIERKVNKPFVIENTDGQRLALLPDDFAMISILGTHRDEKYFPEPNKFDPERFSDENKKKIKFYSPFGIGPRSCIASRFALMTMKTLIFRLVENFRFECGLKTEIPLKMKRGTPNLEFENGIWLDIQNRK